MNMPRKKSKQRSRSQSHPRQRALSADNAAGGTTATAAQFHAAGNSLRNPANALNDPYEDYLQTPTSVPLPLVLQTRFQHQDAIPFAPGDFIDLISGKPSRRRLLMQILRRDVDRVTPHVGPISNTITLNLLEIDNHLGSVSDARRYAILYYATKFRHLFSILTPEDCQYLELRTEFVMHTMQGLFPRFVPSGVDLLWYMVCPCKKEFNIGLRVVDEDKILMMDTPWCLVFFLAFLNLNRQRVAEYRSEGRLGGVGADIFGPSMTQNGKSSSSSSVPDLRKQADADLSAGRYAEAHEAFTTALQEVKGLQIPKADRGALHAGKAAAGVGLERWDEVQNDCKQALKLDPYSVQAYKSLSHALEARGDHAELLRHLVRFYGIVSNDKKLREEVMENLLAVKAEPGSVSDALINLKPDQPMWKFIVRHLVTKRKYRLLIGIIRAKPAQKADHPLNRIKGGDYGLPKKLEVGSDFEAFGEFATWLAQKSSIAMISNMEDFVGRPASFAMWLAFMHYSIPLLDHVLSEGEHLKEDNYPNQDGLHELLQACAERVADARPAMLGSLRDDLQRRFGTGSVLTIEELKRSDGQLFKEIRSILREWRKKKEFGPFTTKAPKKKSKSKAQRDDNAETTVNDEPVEPPDPCDDCQDRLSKADDAVRTKVGNVFSLLCPILGADHELTRHGPIAETAYRMVLKALKGTQEMPGPVLLLNDGPYQRLLEIAQPDWAIVIKMVEQKIKMQKGQKIKIAKNIDLAEFIKSDYLLQSPKYREDAMKSLLQAGASAVRTAGLKSPLQAAAEQKDGSCVNVLVQHGADPRDFHLDETDTPLHAALQLTLDDGDTTLLQYFKDLYEANNEKFAFLAPHSPDKNGNTLLHIVAKVTSSKNSKVLRITEYLRTWNIDPNLLNNERKKAQDYLDQSDRRRRFLQADIGRSPTTVAADRSSSTTLAVSSEKKYREVVLKLNQIVEKLPELALNAEEELSETESENEDEDDETQKGYPELYCLTEEEKKLIERANLTKFDDLPWEVECTTDVWKALLGKKVGKELRRLIIHRIRELALGNFKDSCQDLDNGLKCMQLGKVKVIWQIAIAFSGRRSEEKDGRKVYAEIIRVWDVLFDDQKLEGAIKRINGSNDRGKESVVRKHLKGIQGQILDGKRLPATYSVEPTSSEHSVLWTPPASSKENEYHIMKFYSFTSAMANYISENEGTKVDFPFNVTDIEYTYVHLTPQPPSPLLILGRSGTGKTTCCLYRLWAKYQTYWHKTKKDSPLIPRLTNSEEHQHQHCDHLHQVFVTKNRVLTKEVKKNFMFLCRTSSGEHEDQPLPTKLGQVEEKSFPLFLTSRQYLLLLDGSLPQPFFERDETGAMVNEVEGWGTKESERDALILHDEEEQDAPAQRKARGALQEVTYEIFAHKLWPKLRKASKKKGDDFHPSLVWMEIISFIKGSHQAAQSEKGFLTLDEYKTLGRKQAPHFTGDRTEVYAVFEAYQRVCRMDGYFDECDVVHHVYRRLDEYGNADWVVHQIFVDEVQDFTQSELCVLIQTCQEPNDMFFTGDTAQSIMRGVAFRFTDLKTLFHGMEEKCFGQAKVTVPKHVYKLTQNYRSHAGVIRLANGIIELLKHYFPQSFDHVKRDVALFEGPRPVVFDSVEFEDLALVLRGNQRHVSQIEFGAHQAIIVANDEAREQVPEALNHCLILTVYEAKGLEFDDVLIFNFFKHSEARQEWRVVSQYLQDLASKQDAQEADNTEIVQVDLDSISPDEHAHPLEFDPDKHKILNSELKHLYTAMTRARVNIWIYDEDLEARKPMFEFFKARKLVVSKQTVRDGTSLEEVFVKKSSAYDWRRIGKEFYRRKQYGPASKCFKRAGEETLYKICAAHQLALKAQDSQNDSSRRDQYLQAALQFLQCPQWRHLYDRAATCLRNGKEPLLAANVYARIGKFGEAGSLYRRCKQFELAVDCYERADMYDLAIRLLCEQRRFQDALSAWKVYEAKVKECHQKKDVARARILSKHCPQSRDDKRTIAFRVAENKLTKDDVESVTHILTDLGWSTDQIAGWMADKGKRKAAAMLLAKQGKLLEAAARYREMDDYPSAIDCLDRCKDLQNAKRQLADCYLIMCRRYYKQIETDDTTISRGEYRMYMDKALQFFEQLSLPVFSGQCLLIEGALDQSKDMYQAANQEFVRAGSDMGQLECLYQLMRLENLDQKQQILALKLWKSVRASLVKKGGSVYEDVHKFYGIDEGFVDENSPTRIADLKPELVGYVDVAKANEVISTNLLRKFEFIARKSLKTVNDRFEKSTTSCSKYGCKGEGGVCPYLHGGGDESTKFQKCIWELGHVVMVHGVLLDLYLDDIEVKKLLDKMGKDEGIFNLNCRKSLIDMLFVDKANYAKNLEEVRGVIQVLQGRNIEAMLCLKSDLRFHMDVEDLRIMDSDCTQLLYLLYGSLLSGQFTVVAPFKSLQTLLGEVEKKSVRTWPGEYYHDGGRHHIFRVCLRSFEDHYLVLDPHLAMKTCNHFLKQIAFKSRDCRKLKPEIEVLMPIWELQLMRGLLLYVKASPFVPAFLPLSYIHIINVFDAACGTSTKTLIQNYIIRYPDTFHTTVRNQLSFMCEVFLGVTCRQFNILKDAASLKKVESVERVLVFGLVLLVNVGLSIEENLSFMDRRSKKKKKWMNLQTEEMLVRRIQGLVKHTKLKSEGLSQLTELIRTAKGPRDLAAGLCEYVNGNGDKFMEVMCMDDAPCAELEVYPAESHKELENKYILFQPEQTTEAYKVLHELNDTHEPNAEEDEDKQILDRVVPVKIAQPVQETVDEYTDERRCDVCGTSFVTDDVRQSSEQLRHQHVTSPEHDNMVKVYKKYQAEVKPFVEHMTDKVHRLLSDQRVLEELNPDVLHEFYIFKALWQAFELKRRDVESRRDWRSSGMLTLPIRELTETYEQLSAKISACYTLRDRDFADEHEPET